jgi:type VI secretion system secreted protein VgrG
VTTNLLSVELASGDPLDVRDFSVSEAMSTLFDVRLTAMSTSPDVDFEGAIGGAARFEINRLSAVDGETRYWNGICARVGLIRVEPAGLSTYAVRIVPVMWLLTQRRNYRIFQDLSELDIAQQVLAEWGIQPTLLLDPGSYTDRRMRVQYAESDFDFVSRLLEDIGVAYYFEQSGGQTSLVLVDAPNKGAVRPPVSFVDQPNERLGIEHVTDVHTHREVRPGRYTQSDVDYRKALTYPLASSASAGVATESQLERYHHNYGSFLWKAQQAGGETPVADDRGPARTSEQLGQTQVQKRLDAQRVVARVASFRTNAYDLRPGKVFNITGHARTELAAPLLVVASTFSGNAVDAWAHTCHARYTDVDYRPELRTPKPSTHGVESATVTGPAGEQIHTDEFGRVRVHFHWDRAGADDETSSAWVPVNQPWAGAGFGAINLPRVGQEVLIDFLGSDPDRPVVMGRVFTLTTPPPYQLPKHKMVSGLRSETYPRPSSAPAQASLGAPSATDNGASASGAAAGGNPLPGLRGVQQAPQQNLVSAVDAMTSKGSDLVDHTRDANALTFDDTAGAEKLYLQANKDFNLTIKNDEIASIGGNYGATILGNATTAIVNYQATAVGKDRTVAVVGDQAHEVGGNVEVVCKGRYLLCNTTTGQQIYTATTRISLGVGNSMILIYPDSIVIDAPQVFINPGSEVMNSIASGASPQQAAADAKKAQEAEAAAKQKALNEAVDQAIQNTPSIAMPF